MPGRQAHGRSLIAAPKGKARAKPQGKSKARAQKNALDAFGIAQNVYPTKQTKTPRARQLDAEVERKHARDDGEEDEDEAGEEEPPRRKKARTAASTNDDVEFGSDSEGNEWTLGGMAEDDEDSEIESDDAFGDTDEDKFAGYSFGGSKSKKAQDSESEGDDDDDDDDEGETLGEDAIDLATALDQYESSDEEPRQKGDESGSDDSNDASDESASDDEGSDEEDDSDDEADPRHLEELQGLISSYGGADPEEAGRPSKLKIGLGDLGLSGLSDPLMKKSVKLLNKEDKEKRPGAAKKLDVPLPRRQQDKIDRNVAYEKTNETLGRWTETVKQNRRAEHLVFPLAQNSASAGLDNAELKPLKASDPNNELEATIMSIMDQSGLSMEKESKPKPQEFDEAGNLLSRKEALNRRRIERELASRESKRSKRIKKIKSKAYHRVHRKQRERDDMATREAMEEAGEIDSEEEREAQDRRRALERVGQRHKESKWAKLGGKAKRAVWDDDYRSGLTEMARKDEELRQRKEGRRGGSDDSDSDSVSDSDDDGALRRKLAELEAEEQVEPQSGLMGMKFMQRAEAEKRKANEELIQQIRKDLDGDDGQAGPDDEEAAPTGRRKYGAPGEQPFQTALDTSKRASKRSQVREADGVPSLAELSAASRASRESDGGLAGNAETAASTAGAWSRGESRRKKGASARPEDLDLQANVIVATQADAKPAAAASSRNKEGKPKHPKQSAASVASATTAGRASASDSDATSSSGSDSDSEAEAGAGRAGRRQPLALRDHALVARAFAGEDVVGEFEREKAAQADADDDKVVDNTLPGWGSWVGEGVSSREQRRHQGRFLTKVEGVVKMKDRKDAKLERVIINEKRVKKNDRYLASQLPHPFESVQQYERSLRVPVGPEWTTKETFQEGTKPRVIMKQGIIAPMSKPMV